MATAGDKGKVTIMSSAKENFGEVISTLEATGTFGTAVEYVGGPSEKGQGLMHILTYTESQSKSGGLLAVASDKGYVSLFDSESGALVTAFPGK